MNTRIRVVVGLVVGAALLALAGCIDTATTVTVKTDGSGTIERTIMVSNQLVDLMVSMGMGTDAAAVQGQMLGEGDLRNTESLGAGVTLVSLDPLATDKGKGFRALYRFTDITKVRVDQSPSGAVKLPESPNPENTPAGPELVTFGFSKGSPATLTIRTPRPAAGSATPAAEPQAQGGEEAAAMMGMFRDLYADMRVVVSVVVQGTITKTNATHVSGATVTIMDLDFSQILKDDSVFQKLASSGTQSIAQTQALLKGVPGVKVETQETVTVTFR